MAAVFFRVAWALFDLWPWAWLVAAVASGGQIVLNVGSAIGGNFGWPQAAFASVVPLNVFAYLFRSNVRAAFGC